MAEVPTQHDQDTSPDVRHSAKDLKWKAVSMTNVEYVEGDMIGYILAWSSLLPFCLGVSFVTLIAFRRDLHTISYFLGIVLNEATNLILKHIIQEPRPKRGRDNLYTEYGMPSSHTQFMWFFATYMVFFISVRVYRNYNIIDDLWKIAVCTLSFLAAAVVTYSRIYLEYHTVGQVLCGAVLGIVNGTLWFAVVQFVLTPFFPLIAASPVGEFCMVRDSTLIPHVLWFEYTSSRSEARSRQRKSVSKNNKKELAEDAITKDLQVQMDHSPRLSLAVLDKYVHCSSSFLR